MSASNAYRPYLVLPLLLGTGLALAGCAATPAPDGEPATPPKVTTSASVPSPEAPEQPAGEPAPLLPSAFFPGDAETFVAWRCTPAQDLVSAATQDRLRLWSAQGAYRLEPAVVASGARYVKGELSFWNKGEEAMVESDKGRLDCRQDQTRQALTRRERPGVMFHGRGNEPGWTVRLANDRPRLSLLLDNGERELEAPYRVAALDNEEGRVRLVGGRVDQPFTLTLEGRACFDDMSGEPFPARVTLEIDGETYRGCGQGIAP